jgi:hypothetical protein
MTINSISLDELALRVEEIFDAVMRGEYIRITGTVTVMSRQVCKWRGSRCILDQSAASAAVAGGSIMGSTDSASESGLT